MRKASSTLRIAIAVLAGLLAGCGQENTADSASRSTQSFGLDRFLIFPNPQVQDDGSFQVASQAYADAYYAAIDPSGARRTLAAFMALNQFDSGTGTQHLVVFRDTHDLGSGRRMTGRRNVDGTLAFVVENYRVDAGIGLYTSINLDAAVARDTKWLFGVNAIEFSPLAGGPTPNCGNCVVKFYNYDPATDQRQTLVDLDTRGGKAMPTICISCHGGRGDPLQADGSFPRTVTSLTVKGNTQARLQPFDVPSFEFSTVPGYTRADQESRLRDFNQWVLCSFPMGAGEPAGGINACRPAANPNEWESAAAADMIKVWYGGVAGGTAALGASATGTYVPAGWAGRESLWSSVVARYCRACHLLRGTRNQNDIAFSYFTGNPISGGGFDSYKGRIKAHVFDRGNMPLSLFVQQNFWSDPGAVSALADFLEDGTTPSGVSVPVRIAGLIPEVGRPVADPGPDRRVATTATLSAVGSLFATSYQWAVQGACSASIANPTAQMTSLSWAAAPGSVCVIALTVANGTGQSDTKALTLTRDNLIPAVPTFADVQPLFANLGCTGCHFDTDPAGGGGVPPIFYTDYNRGGTPGSEGDLLYVADASDNDYWFYKELRGRVNLTDHSASPLLRKPTGNSHGGGQVITVTSTGYSIIANWIVNGAPYQ